MADVTNSTSLHLTHTTPPVTATLKPKRTSDGTSSPVSKTSTIPNPSSHSSTSQKNKSSARQPTSQSADDDTAISFHINEAPGIDESKDESDVGLQIGLAGIVMVMVVMATAIFMSIYMYNHPTSSVSLFFMERRPTHWPILKFRRGSGRPSYAEVEAPGQDRDGTVVIDFKESFALSDRRESEQKEGFIVPDQRECFLSSERS